MSEVAMQNIFNGTDQPLRTGFNSSTVSQSSLEHFNVTDGKIGQAAKGALWDVEAPPDVKERVELFKNAFTNLEQKVQTAAKERFVATDARLQASKSSSSLFSPTINQVTDRKITAAAPTAAAQTNAIDPIQDKINASKAKGDSTQMILAGVKNDLKQLGYPEDAIEMRSEFAVDPKTGRYLMEPYTDSKFPHYTFYRIKTTYYVDAKETTLSDGTVLAAKNFKLERPISTTALNPEDGFIVASQFKDLVIKYANEGAGVGGFGAAAMKSRNFGFTFTSNGFGGLSLLSEVEARPSGSEQKYFKQKEQLGGIDRPQYYMDERDNQIKEVLRENKTPMGMHLFETKAHCELHSRGIQMSQKYQDVKDKKETSGMIERLKESVKKEQKEYDELKQEFLKTPHFMGLFNQAGEIEPTEQFQRFAEEQAVFRMVASGTPTSEFTHGMTKEIREFEKLKQQLITAPDDAKQGLEVKIKETEEKIGEKYLSFSNSLIKLTNLSRNLVAYQSQLIALRDSANEYAETAPDKDGGRARLFALEMDRYSSRFDKNLKKNEEALSLITKKFQQGNNRFIIVMS